MAGELDARGGVVSSFQGQSLALEHRIKPKASIAFHGAVSPGVWLGLEALTHADPLPGYFLAGGVGSLRLNMVSGDVMDWNLVFGCGVGNAPDILFRGLQSRTPWTLLVQGGTELRFAMFGGWGYTIRILSENVMMVSVESGLAMRF